MIPARRITLTAEVAASRGRPLPAALDEAVRDLEVIPGEVGAAAAHAEAGDLPAALGALVSLGLDPAVAAAARLAPDSAATVASRLRALPDPGHTAAHLVALLVYASLVVSIQLVLGVAIVVYVSPVLEKLGAGPVRIDYLPWLFGVALLAALVTSMALLDRRGREAVVGRLAGAYLAARGVLIASALAEHGVPPARALDALEGSVGRRAHWAVAGAGLDRPDADALHGLGLRLAVRARAQIDRRFNLLSTGVLAVFLFTGALLVYRVYAAVFGITLPGVGG